MFLVPVECVDACHFLRSQLEVEHGDILFLVVGIARTGDDCHAMLQVPAQDDLCRGFAVRFGYLLKSFVAEHCLCIASAAEGIPPLYDNAVAVHKFPHLFLLIIGMNLVLSPDNRDESRSASSRA